MGGRNLTFRLLYRLGFTPWDGHPLARSLTELVEGGTLTPGRALDLGCGTGDNAIYLAEHGWQVTAVDYVEKPLAVARAKTPAGLDITFARADVTQLSAEPVGAGFDLVIDSGCFHGMSATDRDAYVREVTAVVAPGARLLLVAFTPGRSTGVPGIEPSEVQRRFASGWTMLDQGDEPSLERDGKSLARFYLLARN